MNIKLSRILMNPGHARAARVRVVHEFYYQITMNTYRIYSFLDTTLSIYKTASNLFPGTHHHYNLITSISLQ